MKRKLPARADFGQLRKQAKALLKSHKSASASALQRIREHPRWRHHTVEQIRRLPFKLADAQLVLAGEYGFGSWAALKAASRAERAAPASEAAIGEFLTAAHEGDLPRVQELLDAHPEILNERGNAGTRGALHFAVFGNHVETIRYLLERGADPNIVCEGDSATPLHFAAERNAFESIRLLVEHGADVNANGESDYHELGVIGWATCFGEIDPQIVDYLLARGAEHTIFSAVATGDVKAIRAIVARAPAALERRMDLVNMRRRPLHLAVTKQRPESVRTLLELGANKESPDESGFTPLDEAAVSANVSLAQMLLDAGANVRMPAAIALGRTADIESLLRREPACLKPGGRWGTLIVRAAEKGSGEVVEALLRHGASVDVHDDPRTAIDSTSGYAPLHAAGFFGNLPAARVLLNHGANVRARDERYEGTPAGWAAYAGHKDVCDLILEGPIDIFEAIEMRRPERISAILQQEPQALEHRFSHYLRGTRTVGSFFKRVSRASWYTPLAFAVHAGLPQATRMLLDHGADTKIRSPDGQSLLDLARESGNHEVLQLLSQRRSSPSPNGSTTVL